MRPASRRFSIRLRCTGRAKDKVKIARGWEASSPTLWNSQRVGQPQLVWWKGGPAPRPGWGCSGRKRRWSRPGGWPTLAFDFSRPKFKEAAPPSAVFRGWELCGLHRAGFLSVCVALDAPRI